MDRHDFEDIPEPIEIIGIAGIERKPTRQSGGGDEHVYSSSASSLSTDRGYGRVDTSVRTSCIGIERQGIECRLDPLQVLLATSAPVRIGGSMRPSGKLRERQRADGGLIRQQVRIDPIEVNDY